MSILPSDVLRVASDLKQLTIPKGEPRYRTIAGRSYYAAYSETCAAMRAKYGFPKDSYLPHATLSEAIADVKNDPDVAAVGTLLNTLRLMRITADYHLGRNLQEQESDDAVEHAEEILKSLPSIAARLPKVTPETRA